VGDKGRGKTRQTPANESATDDKGEQNSSKTGNSGPISWHAEKKKYPVERKTSQWLIKRINGKMCAGIRGGKTD